MSDIQYLIKMLQSNNPDKRYDACEELKVSPSLPLDALEALRLVTNDADPYVADAAQRALAVHTEMKNEPNSNSHNQIESETSFANKFVSDGMIAYIGAIPGVALGLFIGGGFGCSAVIFLWIGGCILLPFVGIGLASIISKNLKNSSAGLTASGISGFIIGIAVGLGGIPVGC